MSPTQRSLGACAVKSCSNVSGRHGLLGLGHDGTLAERRSCQGINQTGAGVVCRIPLPGATHPYRSACTLQGNLRHSSLPSELNLAQTVQQ